MVVCGRLRVFRLSQVAAESDADAASARIKIFIVQMVSARGTRSGYSNQSDQPECPEEWRKASWIRAVPLIAGEQLQSLHGFRLATALHPINSIEMEVPMLVRDLMTKNVTSCRPDNNLAELAEIMWNQRCGALPILDGAGGVLGVVTDRDICI